PRQRCGAQALQLGGRVLAVPEVLVAELGNQRVDPFELLGAQDPFAEELQQTRTVGGELGVCEDLFLFRRVPGLPAFSEWGSGRIITRAGAERRQQQSRDRERQRSWTHGRSPLWNWRIVAEL